MAVMQPVSQSGKRSPSPVLSEVHRSGVADQVISFFVGLYIGLLYLKQIGLILGYGESLEYVNAIALAFCLCCLAITIKKPPLVSTNAFWCLLLSSCLLVTLSIVRVSTRGDILQEARGLLGSWTTFIVFYGIGRKRSASVTVMVVLAACAAANAGVALWGASTGERLFNVSLEEVGFGAFGYDPSTGRSGGIVGENYMGMYTAPAVAVGFALLTSRRAAIVGTLLMVVGVLGTTVSLSRTSVLSVMAVLVVVGSTLAPRHRIRLGFGLVLLVAVFQIFSLLFLDAQLDRLDDRARLDASNRWSTEAFGSDMRYSIWESYADDLVLYSVFGAGPSYLEDRVRRGDFLPHNSFADVALKYGIPGLLLYLAPILWMVFNRSRVRNRLTADPIFCSVIASGVACLVSMMFLSSPGVRHLWIFTGLAIGALDRRGAE